MDTGNTITMDSAINQELLLKLLNTIDIIELDFSVRTYTLLKRVGLDTIGKLCSKTKLDLLKNEFLSYRSINEAEKKLKQIGLCLKPLGFSVVTKNDWKRLPVSNVSISFDIEFQLSEEQYLKLKRGNIPCSMDEWFIYYEKGELRLYRCTTGLCIFSVKLNELCHKHYVTTYIYNLDNIKEWNDTAPETVKMVLSKYARN